MRALLVKDAAGLFRLTLSFPRYSGVLMRLLLLSLLSLLAVRVHAQEATTTAYVYDWPLSAHTERVSDRHWRNLDVLPFVDRLALTVAAADAGDAPDLSARVSWQMGTEGIKKGRRVPAREMPAGVHLVAFVLRADVMEGGRRVAGFTLAVDSTRLAAGETLMLTPQATWELLFDEVGADEAQRIVRSGFTLENLRLVRAAFGVFGRETSSAAGTSSRKVSERSVYDAYPDVWIEVAWDLTWLLGAEAHGGHGVRRKMAPRGSTGRATTRGERGSRDSSEDNEEKEDESGELLPAAAMVGAALVTGAIFSGSAGYAAQADEPIGFATGIVRERGGVVVQASANPAALGMHRGDESLTGQVLFFWGGRNQFVQPAVGLGARYHETHGDLHVDAAVTLGGMFRLGRASLLAGYEVVGQRPAFGLIYSWRMW